MWFIYGLLVSCVLLAGAVVLSRWRLKREEEYYLAWRRGVEAAWADSCKAMDDLHTFLQEAKKVKQNETREG